MVTGLILTTWQSLVPYNSQMSPCLNARSVTSTLEAGTANIKVLLMEGNWKYKWGGKA
jgi:hypothetical protein